MPSKSEIERRKAIVQNLQATSRAEQEASRVVPQAALAALFEHLDVALRAGCDHSLRHTRAFLASQDLPVESAVEWLGSFGGYCDCEVLANVEDVWPQGRAI